MFFFLTIVCITSLGQSKRVEETLYSNGYYSGLTLVLKPDMTFTLKFYGHISTDTAAGTYMLQGDTIFFKYDYNNYEKILLTYRQQNKQVPIDIQLSAGRIVLRPTMLIKRHYKFYVVDETTGLPKTYNKNGKTHFVYLKRAK